MPQRESRQWPAVVSLRAGVPGLGCNVEPPPKCEELAEASSVPRAVLATTDAARQERQLVHDVFRVLVGGEGEFVRYTETFDPELLDDRLLGPQYRLQPGIGPGLRDMLGRIAEAASCAYAVRTYADHFAGLEYGCVNQALGAGLRVLLQLYLESIALLEREQTTLTLYQVWVHLEPLWPHLENARQLIQRFIEETRLLRERKRHGAHDDLVARATTAQFVAHGEQEATIELRGGAVLKVLAVQLRLGLGNAAAANFHRELLEVASGPYLAMLQKWLSEGVVDDPHDEFLIQETRAHNLSEVPGQQSVDEYWNKRYTIRARDLPLQLSAPHLYDCLLVAGKYLNILRDTVGSDSLSSEISCARELEQCTSVEDPRVAEIVMQVYKAANRQLLNVFASTAHDLRALLRSLRTVFFFVENDTFAIFLDLAAEDLAQPVDQVPIERLESYFTLSRGPDDPLAQSVGLSYATESLRDAMLRILADEDAGGTGGGASTHSGSNSSTPAQSLTAGDALQITFKVPFPLSLAVPHRSIVRYQFLSRHIINIMMAQHALTHAWELQTLEPQWRATHSNRGGDAAGASVGHWKQRAHALRQRQLLFVNELLYHCTRDSIHGVWAEMLSALNSLEEVSDVVEKHISFLDWCLVNCYLAHPQLLRFQTRLLTQCRQYGQFLDVNIQLVGYMASDSGEAMVGADGRELRAEDLLQWFSTHIERYESAFDRNLQRFYEQLNAFVPTNFVAGGTTALFIQRLELLLARRPTSSTGESSGDRAEH